MSREEAATQAGMRHYGYTDEQIAFAEQPVAHTEECEFIEQVGWDCIGEDGKSMHPESDELSAEFEMAQVHIAAADAYDAAHNVHRVVLDDATVERAIAEISHHVTPVIGWMVLAASQGRDPDKYHDDLTKRIELAARAVLAAAVKEER